MKISNLKVYQFQTFNISDVNYFPKINIRNDHERKYHDRILEIDYNFMSALRAKKWNKFIKNFNSISDELVRLDDNEAINHEFFKTVLKKLVYFGLSTQNREIDFENPRYLIKNFKIDSKSLKKYISYTELMKENNTRILKVNLDSEIKTIINDQVKNLIENHLNERIFLPWGHVRFSSLKFDSCICKVRKLNPFGNYHYDGDIYSFPIIIYLDKVDKKNGGFSYVEESLNSKVSYTLRAFSDYSDSANTSWILAGDINKIRDDNNYHKFLKLPKILQSSKAVSFMSGKNNFEKYSIKEFNGNAGDTILFDGFHIIHEGGFPINGDRFALFINYKFPRQHINKLKSKILT